MPTDKQPRNSAAKKTTRSNTKVPTNSQEVSTASPVAGTEMNAIIEGNGAADLDEIRKRAYELYEEDGRQDGRHEDHWLRAESEVRNRDSRKNRPTSESAKSSRRSIAS